MGICQSMFDQGTDVDVSEVSAPVFILLNQCMCHSACIRMYQLRMNALSCEWCVQLRVCLCLMHVLNKPPHVSVMYAAEQHGDRNNRKCVNTKIPM